MFILMGLWAFECGADPKVFGLELKNRMSATGNGHYNLLLEELRKMGVEHSLQVYPLPRRALSFRNNKTSCVFPGAINSERLANPDLQNQALIEGATVDYAGLAVVSKKGSPQILAPSDLDGLRLASLNGFDTSVFFPSDIEFYMNYVREDEQLINMLLSKRVDAIVGFFPDLTMQLASSEVDLELNDPQLWLIPKQGVSMVCHETPENIKFMQRFNKGLEKLKKTGRLEQILGPHAIYQP